jgi:alpha-amylase/alpha-mannosidase (GH57 family)
MIGRYPRYRELWERFRGVGFNSKRGERYFQTQDYVDLQVLSQISWVDEFFLEEPELSALIRKQRNYSEADQRSVIDLQKSFLSRVLPAYAEAAAKKQIEISTSPFYHPILPLLCDTAQGAVSSPGRPLPQNRFRYPEDARQQLERGLALHKRVFGVQPRGVWPSEGSVSEEVLAIAAELGVEWMATDEGVLGRSIGYHFDRDDKGRLLRDGPDKLYTIYRYGKGQTEMNLVFRDHTLSDLIGFVYSGMSAKDAASHFIHNIKQAAEPLVKKGKPAMIPIILDGENAWEYYPASGREFLRRVYDALQRDASLQACTVSEAIAAQHEFPRLRSLVPGSWINANFNIWIGAPEDNRAWDHLSEARAFYASAAPKCSAAQRSLAFEEILIAEGSDWNWWYGPEHHTANDRDFDELYRKHLSNVYQALGATPPEALAQPITREIARPSFVPQTAYIHPRLDRDLVGYFDWLGAAIYTADRRAGAMHGKQFLLDSVYAGIDEANLYGRMDFAGPLPPGSFDLMVNCSAAETSANAVAKKNTGKGARNNHRARSVLLQVSTQDGKIQSWVMREGSSKQTVATGRRKQSGVELRLRSNFEFKLPLAYFDLKENTRLRLRFSIWQNHLPVDALPLEGWIELQLASEEELEANIYG